MPCATAPCGSAPRPMTSTTRTAASRTTRTPTSRTTSKTSTSGRSGSRRIAAPRATFRSDDEISVVLDLSLARERNQSYQCDPKNNKNSNNKDSNNKDNNNKDNSKYNSKGIMRGLRRSLSMGRSSDIRGQMRRSRSTESRRNRSDVSLIKAACPAVIADRLQQEEPNSTRHSSTNRGTAPSTPTTLIISPWSTTSTKGVLTSKMAPRSHPFAQRLTRQTDARYMRAESSANLESNLNDNECCSKRNLRKKRSAPSLLPQTPNNDELQRLESAQQYIVDALKAFHMQQNNEDPKDDNVEATTPSTSRSRRPTRRSSGLLRRHSFSSRSSEQSESPDASKMVRRQSRTLEDAIVSEQSSFVPLRQRLKGLFGSFGKGGNRRRNRSAVNASSSDYALHAPNVRHASPSPARKQMVKTSMAEFTRQIERLTAVPNDDHIEENLKICKNRNHINNVNNGTTVDDRREDRGKEQSIDLGIKDDIDIRNKSNNEGNQRLSGAKCYIGDNSSPISSEDEEDNNDEYCTKSKLDRRDSGQGSSPASGESESSALPNSDSRKVFLIANELMTSERVFVDVLRLLNVEFRQFVSERSSSQNVINETDLKRLFGNLDELQRLGEGLLADFENRVSNWEQRPKIADVIVEKGHFLKLFTTYIREFSTTNLHFDRCCQRSPKFAKLVDEFERMERCRSLKLKHFMLKPVQRLPQYKLLLEDYLKHLDPNCADFDDTTAALRIVAEAAERANDTIKQGDEFRRLLRLQSRLNDPDLIRPGRQLLKEGSLQKISRKGDASARYFVLLSDCLLYCALNNGQNLKISYTIDLEGLQVRVRAKRSLAKSEDTEFIIVSEIRSCVLRACSVEERNEWLDAINSAIEEHANRQASFASINESNEHETSREQNSWLGKRAPVWISDRDVTMCQLCAAAFGVLVRRHHCRACGRVVCHACSGLKAKLAYRQNQLARVCIQCFQSLIKEAGLEPRLTRSVPARLRVGASVAGETAQLAGHLRRRGARGTRRNWYVLRANVLYEYKASEDAVATDALPLLGLNVDAEPLQGDDGFGLCVWHESGVERLSFVAETRYIRDMWLTALNKASSAPVDPDCVDV